MRRAAAAAAAALLVAAAGCDVNGDGGGSDDAARRPRRGRHDHARRGRRGDREGRRLRPGGDLPPARRRAWSRSCRSSAAARACSTDGGEGGQGSGFVLDGDGYIATNAHVVTTDAPTREARRPGLRRVLGRQPRAGEDRRPRPERRRRAPEGRPGGPVAHAARLGESTAFAVGEPVAAIGSPFGERQSLSIGVISALDRDDRVAHAVRDRRRDPDRRRDQPRQLRRAAARRAGSRDRHQRADQVAVRRRRGRGLRGPGGHRAPLARELRAKGRSTTATWA